MATPKMKERQSELSFLEDLDRQIQTVSATADKVTNLKFDSIFRAIYRRASVIGLNMKKSRPVT